jgi:hypothetical protein
MSFQKEESKDNKKGLSEREKEKIKMLNKGGKKSLSPIPEKIVNSEPRQEAGHALLQIVEPEEAVTQRDIKRKIYSEHPLEYESWEEWWDSFGFPLLEEHPEVDRLDNSGLRWRQSSDR